MWQIRLTLFLFALFAGQSCLANNLPLNLLHVPPGFKIEIYAYPVPGARSLTLGDQGIVFVGTREEGVVYAIIPDKTSEYHTHVATFAEGLNSPNGVAFYHGDLYVAEIDRVIRYDDIENQLKNPPAPVIIVPELPNDTVNGWRYLGFNRDGKMYISIGMPCNVCMPSDPQFGTILRMNADGSGSEIFAKGIRDCEGFDFDPVSRSLWFTDNGRDWMGADRPPDKLNMASTAGENFGFPYYDGKDMPDPEFGRDAPFKTFTLPAFELPAHVAPLGMRFYTGTVFPEAYRNQIFIAEHGSWNGDKKVGYQVVVANRTGSQVDSVTPFITGWLQQPAPWGRPVDLLVMPDGSLLISDDLAGVVYRVSYK